MAVAPAAAAAALAQGSRAARARIEFFFDIVSPYSYVAYVALNTLRTSWPVDIALRPFFLGGVMHATGNQPPGMNPYKAKYMSQDLRRQIDFFGATLTMPSAFPLNTLSTMRLLSALDLNVGGDGRSPQLWSAVEDVSDAAVLKALLCPDVIDPALWEKIAKESREEPAKARLKATSEEAVSRGGFGAPLLFVQRADEAEATMYFGSDRFHLIARQIGQELPSSFTSKAVL